MSYCVYALLMLTFTVYYYFLELFVKKNEEVHNIKMDYELKIAFLFKELKKLEDMRVQQISKITQISQQRFMYSINIVYFATHYQIGTYGMSVPR